MPAGASGLCLTFKRQYHVITETIADNNEPIGGN